MFENKYYIYQNQVCQACKLSIFSVNKSRMLGLSIIYFLCCSLSPELHCIKTEKQFTRYIRESKCKPGVYIFSWTFCFFPPPFPTHFLLSLRWLKYFMDYKNQKWRTLPSRSLISFPQTYLKIKILWLRGGVLKFSTPPLGLKNQPSGFYWFFLILLGCLGFFNLKEVETYLNSFWIIRIRLF